MKKHLIWGMIIFSGMVLAADKDQKEELEKLSTESNSTEEQFSKSKSDKSWGSNNYNQGDRFVCESYRGQRQHCRADTNGGVRLVKQVGYNSCQGNWGYDYYGVWVTNGCRGEFQIDRYQDHYGQTENVIRCESYSSRRQTCASNLQGADVQLIHQLSNRNCRGNWGFNQNEIWVANGCKADFLVSRNNYGSGPGYGNGVVECRSFGTNIEHCQVPELQSIELIEELGNSYRDSCRGNWGYSSHGLWVRNGCHARFQVVEYQDRNHNNNNNHNNQGREVVCESNFGQVRTCRADTSGRVELVQNLSNTSCDQRWGYDANGIWVKDGCRARFKTYAGNSGVVNPPVAAPLPKTIKCKSRRNKVKICDTNGPFRDVEFKREISKGKYPCDGNWGVNRQGKLFVKENCYAEFKIYY